MSLGAVAGLAGLCLAALAIRLVRLDEPAPRWDEGWSIAHASLGWGELLRIAALDWHRRSTRCS